MRDWVARDVTWRNLVVELIDDGAALRARALEIPPARALQRSALTWPTSKNCARALTKVNAAALAAQTRRQG